MSSKKHKTGIAAPAGLKTPTEGLVDDWTDQAEQRAWFLFESGRGA